MSEMPRPLLTSSSHKSSRSMSSSSPLMSSRYSSRYISFDVSLFILVHLATEVAQRRLRGDVDLKDHSSLNVEEVTELLEFWLSPTLPSVEVSTNRPLELQWGHWSQ